MPTPRRARLATIRHPATGDLLDRALLLWFPGPATATGEDLAEFHLHGGRAVVRAVEQALAAIVGLRPAIPGEFTRRAFAHGVIDLAEAEGLADLLSAETEAQRRVGLAQSGGALSRQVADWQARLLMLSARVEAMLDFADEDDVAREGFEIANINNEIEELLASWRQWLDRPTTERLRDGVTVAIAGPPNAGKSTLLNALAGRDAAIVSPMAGTTRDVIEVPLAIGGVAVRLADTAGMHGGTGDVIEAEGMARARAWADAADLLLWLGPADEAPAHPNRAIIAAQADRRRGQAEWAAAAAAADLAVSAQEGEGLTALADWLVAQARTLLPREGEVALNARHHAALTKAAEALSGGDGLGTGENDPLLLAESLRSARLSIDSITGQAGTEAMLDALFGRFCIGK